MTLTTPRTANVGALGGALTMAGLPFGGEIVFPIRNAQPVTFVTAQRSASGTFRRLCSKTGRMYGVAVPLTAPYSWVYATTLSDAMCSGPLQDPMTGAVRYGTFRVSVREGAVWVGAITVTVRR